MVDLICDWFGKNSNPEPTHCLSFYAEKKSHSITYNLIFDWLGRDSNPQYLLIKNLYTRVGWKVHIKHYRLTKKELCHNNESWNASNSTFPDTKCIISFQINPHWISNSGLWKVVLESRGISKLHGNWRRESCFTRTMFLHTSLWFQWLWTGWAPFIFSWFGTICSIFISAVEEFFEDQNESFYTTGIQALQHRWKKCVDRCAGETIIMMKNKPHFFGVKFDHCIIVSYEHFSPSS